MVGKKLKKISKGLILALASVLVLASCSSGGDKEASSAQDAVKTIGIVQSAPHPALDAANQGFIKALEEKGYKDGEKIKIVSKNAQGDVANNDQITKKFASDKVDLILAIATQSAQASVNATKDIPILITAVTDPVEAKLVSSLEKPSGNVTGTSDRAPIKTQLEMVKKLKADAKKVGFIYNAGEANSVVQLKEAQKVCQNLGLELVEQTITSTNDVVQAMDSICKKVDVLYVPTDNTAVQAGPTIGKKGIEHKIPVISAEGSVVENGGLLSEGIDYTSLGYKTGLMAADILDGKSKPADMPIQLAEKFTLTINKDTLSKIGLQLPKELEEKATFIGGEK